MTVSDLSGRLDRLSDQLERVDESVRGNRADLAELQRQGIEIAEVQRIILEAQTALKKNARGAKHRNIAIGVLVGVVAVVAFIGWRNNSDRTDGTEKAIIVAQDAIDAAEASRADARLSSCRAYNTDVADRINSILTGLAATSNDPVAAEQLVTQFLLPRRNCTPEGLADYFSTPQGPDAYEAKPTLVPTTTVPGG